MGIFLLGPCQEAATPISYRKKLALCVILSLFQFKLDIYDSLIVELQDGGI